jgi:hypothetical protein
MLVGRSAGLHAAAGIGAGPRLSAEQPRGASDEPRAAGRLPPDPPAEGVCSRRTHARRAHSRRGGFFRASDVIHDTRITVIRPINVCVIRDTAGQILA